MVNKPCIDENFKEIIERFCVSWMDLKMTFNLTIPNKVHIICDHLGDYLERGETFQKKSDQTIKSVHQLFHKQLFKGYFVKNIFSDTFKTNLFNAVLHFNGYHV